MKSIKGTASTASLIWQAQAVSKELELATKRDLAVESRSRFDDAVAARRHAAEARFSKGLKENAGSVWSTVGMVVGLALGALVAGALAVPTGGMSLGVAALVGLASGALGGVSKILSLVFFDRPANAEERRAAESELRATDAQRASEAAKEEAQAAHDRFRSILEDAKTLDQVTLRSFQKE